MVRKRLILIATFIIGAGSIICCPAALAQMSEDWAVRFNIDYDIPAGLAVDGAGNVYLTGETHGSSASGSDYATVKYDTSGNELWAMRYNGPGDFNDYARAIAVDAAGNVYVTGESTGPHAAGEYGAYDYATIKYDTDGNQLWVARYNGPANGWDYASALAVDSSGNVYVTGYQTAADGSSEADYATIKYDTDGNELWVATYNGQANGSDRATRIAVDAAGNVYVTGTSTGPDGTSDYATIKYDADGSALWVARNSFGAQDHPAALAVDAGGNVYVTGSSCTPHGLPPPDLINCVYATVKYDEDGKPLWSATYHGLGDVFAPLNGANALALDGAGNVYVTGGSQASGTGGDYATIKYDAYGSEVWVARYDGPVNGGDSAAAIGVDSLGHVYVTGASAGSDGSLDYATVQYDANGNEQAVSRYSGPAQMSDTPCALAVDSSGNVYVSGSSQGSETSMDYVTVKLSPASGASDSGGSGGGSGGCFIEATGKSLAGLNPWMFFGLFYCWNIFFHCRREEG